MSGDAIVGLLKGAAEVLSQIPTEQVTDGIRQLCQLQTAPLIQVGGREGGGEWGGRCTEAENNF